MADTVRIIDEDNQPVPQYKTHKWRWFVLATFSILAFSNGLNWLTYASIVKYAADFYKVSITDVNYLTIIFFIGSILGSPFAMFVLDSLSLREAVWIGSILNFIGTLIRILSAVLVPPYVNIQYLGFACAMLAQFTIAIAQSYFLFAPPKVAAVWFSDGERVVANTITSLSNVVGIGASMLIAPSIVSSTERLPILLGVTAVPALIGLLMAVLGNCKRKPPFPPSPSSEEGKKTWEGLKLLVRNWQFLFLCVVWSIAAGVFNAFLALIPQFLCPFGYSEGYSGMVGASMIFSGLLGALIFGFIVDKTKWFDEVSKGVMVLTVIASIFLLEVFRLPDQPWLIASSFVLFGFFALILMPLFSELAIEITYPVAEGTCSGILWTSVQFMGAAITFVAPYFGRSPDPKFRSISKCEVSLNSTASDSQGLDYIYLFYFDSALFVLILTAYLWFFWPKLKRVEAERLKRKQQEMGHSDSVN